MFSQCSIICNIFVVSERKTLSHLYVLKEKLQNSDIYLEE